MLFPPDHLNYLWRLLFMQWLFWTYDVIILLLYYIIIIIIFCYFLVRCWVWIISSIFGILKIWKLAVYFRFPNWLIKTRIQMLSLLTWFDNKEVLKDNHQNSLLIWSQLSELINFYSPLDYQKICGFLIIFRWKRS